MDWPQSVPASANMFLGIAFTEALALIGFVLYFLG
jgi:F0F1-type ATP synthase membrane subunit c/vacuolar-type H+-ATPase subunit K